MRVRCGGLLLGIAVLLSWGLLAEPARAQPEPASCLPGQVRACRTASGVTGLSTCRLSGWGPCRARTPGGGGVELCNGLDDDGDGVVDEGADGACDDGLACNKDTCEGGTCRHEPLPTCQSRGCVSRSCQLDDLEPRPGIRVLPRDATGCQTQLVDVICEDQCDCNGKERCSLDGPPVDRPRRLAGCVAPSPLPCENDGDLCTLAACCVEDQPDCLTGPYVEDTLASDPSIVQRTQQACRYLRRRGLTFTAPYDPSDPRPVECVRETEVRIARIGRRVPTYGERDCDDANECTLTGECDPETGLCPTVAALPDTTECAKDRFGDPVAGYLSCGRGLCNGNATDCTRDGCPNATCELVDPQTDPRATPVECPEEVIPASDGPPLRLGRRWTLTRLPHTEGDRNVQYRVSRRRCGFLGFRCRSQSRDIDSCHVSVCPTGSLTCGVAADLRPGTCPEPRGCLDSVCTARTDVLAGSVSFSRPTDAVLGCQETPNPAKCSVPAGSCFAAVCRTDGSCDREPRDELCDPRACGPDTPPVPGRCTARGECEYDCII